MWPFRRQRRQPATGTVRLGEHAPDDAAYDVYAVSESRHPGTFEALWSSATDEERAAGLLRRWATLVPVRDPAFGIADLAVEFEGMRAGYLRPPALRMLAALIERENIATVEVPALVERGPVGASVRLRVDDA